LLFKFRTPDSTSVHNNSLDLSLNLGKIYMIAIIVRISITKKRCLFCFY